VLSQVSSERPSDKGGPLFPFPVVSGEYLHLRKCGEEATRFEVGLILHAMRRYPATDVNFVTWI